MRFAEMKSHWSRSALFGFVSWLLPLGLTFYATPLVVRRLGVEEYGLYALVLGFVSYSFTFSIGRAVTKYVAEFRATGQTKKINEVLAATLWINGIVGLFGTAALCLLARFVLIGLFGIEPEMQENAVIAFYIASVSIFFAMQAQVFSGVLQAVHRLDIFSAMTTLVSVSSIVGNIIIVLNGYGVTELLIWNSLNTIISCGWFYIAGKRLLPEAKWGFESSREIIKLVAWFAAGTSTNQLIFNFLLLFERGLITRVLGTESLTYYVVPMNLTVQIHLFSSSLLLMIFPMASELGAKMEIERLRAIYEQTTKYLFGIVVFIVVSMIVCGYEFFSVWLNPQIADQTFYIVIIQALTFGTMAVGIVAWQIMEGLGNTRNNALVSIPWAALSLVLMLILIPLFQLEGVGMGRLFGCLALVIYILFVEKKVFGKVLWTFWRKILLLSFLPALSAAAAEFVSLHYIVRGWSGLFIACGLGAAIYFSMLLATKFFTFEDRIVLRKLIFKFLPKFS